MRIKAYIGIKDDQPYSARIDVLDAYDKRKELKSRGYKYQAYGENIWTRWIMVADAQPEMEWLKELGADGYEQGCKIKSESDDHIATYNN